MKEKKIETGKGKKEDKEEKSVRFREKIREESAWWRNRKKETRKGNKEDKEDKIEEDNNAKTQGGAGNNFLP